MRTPRGFTLVELLVVIAIMGVLAALVVPAFQRVREHGRATACLANLRQVGVALNRYLGENGNIMPNLVGGRASRTEEVDVLDTVLAPYAGDARIFICPSDKRIGAATGTSYFWNVTLNGQAVGGLKFLQITEIQAQIPLLADKEGFHPYLEDRVNILYADGHATKELNFNTKKL